MARDTLNVGTGTTTASDTAQPVRFRRRAALALATIVALTAPIFTAGAAQAAPNDPVHMPDAALQSCINRTKFGRPAGTVIREGELASLTGMLGCLISGITDLTGLEYATGLSTLYLDRNNISDLSPLSGLHNLTSLYVSNNQIEDLSPISGLTGLSALRINGNAFDTLAPISQLTQLTELSASGNGIEDLSNIADLHHLQTLILSNNQISEVDELATMSSLDHLDLASNNIRDLSVISGLTSLRILRLQKNPIEDFSGLEHLSGLVTLNLEQTGLRDASPIASLTQLTSLGLAGNHIANIVGLPTTSGTFGEQTVTSVATENTAAENPIVGRDSQPIASDSEFYDSDNGVFMFPAAGEYVTSWRANDPGSQPFSGTITWTVSAQAVHPTNPDSGGGNESNQHKGEAVATTGASFPAPVLGIATGLLGAAFGALLLRRRTSRSTIQH